MEFFNKKSGFQKFLELLGRFLSRPSLPAVGLFFTILSASALFLSLSSCTGNPQPGADLSIEDNDDNDEEDDDEDDRAERRSSNRFRSRSRNRFRVRRVNCREKGSNPCEDSDECLDACDDLFSSSKDKQKCASYSEELVTEFYNIFDILDDGDGFDGIEPEALDCLLNLSDKKFKKEVRGLKGPDSKNFLEAVAASEELADVINDEDDSYSILSALIENINSSDFPAFFKDSHIEGSSGFLDLIVEEENEEAWLWAMGHISIQCSSGVECDLHDDFDKSNGKQQKRDESVSTASVPKISSTDSTAKELVFFCKVYEGSSKIRTFLSSELFDEYYGDWIREKKICGDVQSNPKNCQENSTTDFGSNQSSFTASSSTVCTYLHKD